MDRVLYRTLLLFAATVLAIWGFLLLLSPFAVAIAWALCLAAITYTPYVALTRRWKKPRLVALMLVFLTAIVIVVPVGLILWVAAEEMVRLASGGLTSWVADLKDKLPSVHEWVSDLLEPMGVDLEASGEQQTAAAADVATSVAGFLWGTVARGAMGVIGSVFSFLFGLTIMLITQYFMYTDGPKLRRFVRDVSPLSNASTDRLFATLRSTTVAAVLGGLLVAGIQGALGGVGYWIAGIRAPVLWGLVMAFFSLLPMGGAALVWGPAAIYLFAVGETGSAWFLVLWGSIVVGCIDNVLRPWILRRTGAGNVHALLLFFAVLSGIGIFGMSGLVFGPLFIALLLSMTELYRHELAPHVASRADGGGAPAEGDTPG